MATVVVQSYGTSPTESGFINFTEIQHLTEIHEVVASNFSLHGLLWPSLLTALVIATNCTILTAFCLEKRLRTYNNYFIINLSILDLLVGFYMIVTVLHSHIGYYPLNETLCKIISGFGQTFAGGSNFAVVIICIDRHRATYDPINHFTTRSKRRAVVMNSIAWLISFSFWMSYIVGWEFIVDFDNGRHCFRRYTEIPAANVVYTVVIFYMPLVSVAVLYFRIYRKILQTVVGKSVRKKYDIESGSKALDSKMTSEVSTVTIERDTILSSQTGQSTDNVNDVDIESVGPKSIDFALSRKTTSRDVLGKRKLRVRHESADEMRKATRTLLFIVLSFVAAWLPQSIISLIYSIEPSLIILGLPRGIYLIFVWMAYCNSILNPISYAITQPLLRATLWRMFCCCFCKGNIT